MLLCPRDASELQKALLLRIEFHEKEAKEALEEDGFGTAEEHLRKAMMCRLNANSLEFSNEVDDHDLWAIAEELDGLKKRCLNVLASLSSNASSVFTDHANLAEFCRIMARRCRDKAMS